MQTSRSQNNDSHNDGQQAERCTHEEETTSVQTWASANMNPKSPEPKHAEKGQAQTNQRAELQPCTQPGMLYRKTISQKRQGDEDEITWTKGHETDEHVQRRETTELHMENNDEADNTVQQTQRKESTRRRSKLVRTRQRQDTDITKNCNQNPWAVQLVGNGAPRSR